MRQRILGIKLLTADSFFFFICYLCYRLHSDFFDWREKDSEGILFSNNWRRETKAALLVRLKIMIISSSNSPRPIKQDFKTLHSSLAFSQQDIFLFLYAHTFRCSFQVSLTKCIDIFCRLRNTSYLHHIHSYYTSCNPLDRCHSFSHWFRDSSVNEFPTFSTPSQSVSFLHPMSSFSLHCSTGRQTEQLSD